MKCEHRDNKIPCSVAVLTYNSERTLKQALDSLKDFAEIIICDGGSTDETLDIAHSFNAIILPQDSQYKNPNGTIADFSGVRNQTLEAASYDWFLFVDSDEYLSQEVAEEMRDIIAGKVNERNILAYWMPRKRVYKREIVECTTTYPSYQMRFFKKSGAKKFIKVVHERIELLPETGIGYLKNPEYVPFEYNRKQWREKLMYYISIEVKRHQNQPFWSWVKMSVNSCKVSILFLFRHIRIILLCRGHKMPLWYELMQHWYHWQLIMQTGKKYFSLRK